MDIPMKYEDVVAKLDAALRREAALREELAKFKSGCVDLSSQVRELEHKMDYYKGEGLRADDLQQRLTVAEQRAGIMEKALERISRPLGCGCLPCHGDCTSTLALEITVEEMQETAKDALKPAAEGEES